MTFRNILTPTDFSASADAALGHAVQFADRFDATLHLLHAVNELDAAWYGLSEAGGGAPRLQKRIQSEAQDRLYELIPRSAKLDVRTEVAQQLNFEVADAIEDYVAEHAVDLVVMGTHGRRGIGRLVLGSVANKLIRRSSCPVVTVQEDEEEAHRERERYRELLAPIDFSEHSHRALRLSKEIAARYDARLHLLFVAEKRVVPTFSDTGIPGVGVVEMDPDIVENAEGALEELNENVGGPEVESAYHVRKGDVAQDIVNFAETHETDLIVMATRGLTGLTRFMLGSNTERVVRVAPCPVLTVPAGADTNE